MKICATVAEYNPFHNGHLKHLNYIKGNLSADKTVVIMSGNFTQRGEPAVSDKFTRARWAILAGADIVIELPTVFATANAEIFAKELQLFIQKNNRYPTRNPKSKKINAYALIFLRLLILL